VIYRFCKIGDSELLSARRGAFNEPRNLAVYLTRRLTGYGLKRIADQNGFKKIQIGQQCHRKDGGHDRNR